MKCEPLWWDDAPAEQIQATPVPERTDFAVVGSGFAGLSAALAVARAGRDVTILEMAGAGSGAATRNAGFISNELKGGYLGLEARFGEAAADQLMGEANAARDFTLERIRAEQIQCSLVHNGRMILAAKPSHYQAMARECEARVQRKRSDNFMVDRAGLASEIASDRYFGGWVTPDAHMLDPKQFHAGLLARVRAAGVTIIEDCKVTAIARNGEEFTLTTTRGKIAARDVFVATHGYGGDELGWMKRRVINFGWYAIATEELPRGRLQKLLPGARACADSKALFNYFRLNPQGTRLIFGGRAPIFEMPPARAAPFLARAMRKVFPDLGTARVSHAWSGQIAFSFDLLPHIGSHDGIHYATSFTGPGLPLANYLGDKVARRVLGETDTATAFDGIALHGRPYYRGVAWFMPAAMAWYAARDRFSR